MVVGVPRYDTYGRETILSLSSGRKVLANRGDHIRTRLGNYAIFGGRISFQFPEH